jgi:hypothetical protein
MTMGRSNFSKQIQSPPSKKNPASAVSQERKIAAAKKLEKKLNAVSNK